MKITKELIFENGNEYELDYEGVLYVLQFAAFGTLEKDAGGYEYDSIHEFKIDRIIDLEGYYFDEEGANEIPLKIKDIRMLREVLLQTLTLDDF